MTIAFALCAAFGYGVSDFAGGVAARRVPPLLALWGGDLAGLLLVVAVLSPWPGTVGTAGLVDAVAAGIAGLAGLGLTYHLMATEALSIVSPMTAALAAAIPLGVGVAAGERPSPIAWSGVAAAIVAVVLLGAPDGGRAGARVHLRLLVGVLGAGIGFGGYFVLIAHAGGAGGMLGLAVARMTSIVLLTPLVLRRRRRGNGRALSPQDAGGPVRPRRFHGTGVAVVLMGAAGLTDAGADACFFLAARSGSLSLAGVLASLYPAVTVVLAVVALRERASWRPCAGIGLSLLAVALIAT